MKPSLWKQWKTRTTLSLYAKCGAVFLLFLLSVLIVACSSGGDPTAANLAGPVVTATINMGNASGLSPTPTLPAYWCGAWATQAAPNIKVTTEVGVYAKFTQNVDGNPQGVGAATATATVLWPDGNAQTFTVNTTPDGLAVFTIPITNQDTAINKVTLVTVTFNKPGVGTCTVGADQAAFFTLVVASPTAAASSTAGAGGGGPNATPTHCPRKRKCG